MPGDSARRNGLKGGRPKGSKTQRTLDKLAARELVRQKVTQALEPMVRAQIAHATGIGHLYTRDKNGKYTKIENQARVDELLATGEAEKDYWIFTKDPSVQAFTDLLNRALDKPAESMNVEHTGGVEITWKE
jgi:rhamnose utilization protein RhaD (predicted bifunctional aldolase and dehydrogenase)